MSSRFTEKPCLKKYGGDISEMTQQAKVLAPKPDDLSVTLGTHKVKGENQLLQAVL